MVTVATPSDEWMNPVSIFLLLLRIFLSRQWAIIYMNTYVKMFPASARFVGVFLLLAGCTSPPPPTATLTGIVTWQRQTLNHGRIYFNVNNGESVVSSEISPNGAYTVRGLKQGLAKVAVVTPPLGSAPNLENQTDTSAPSPLLTPVEIPKKFGRVETSRVTVQVSSGTSTVDIHLE